MSTLASIIRGSGVSKIVGTTQSRQFLVQGNTNRNIWFSKRRFAH